MSHLNEFETRTFSILMKNGFFMEVMSLIKLLAWMRVLCSDDLQEMIGPLTSLSLSACSMFNRYIWPLSYFFRSKTLESISKQRYWWHSILRRSFGTSRKALLTDMKRSWDRAQPNSRHPTKSTPVRKSLTHYLKDSSFSMSTLRFAIFFDFRIRFFWLDRPDLLERVGEWLSDIYFGCFFYLIMFSRASGGREVRVAGLGFFTEPKRAVSVRILSGSSFSTLTWPRFLLPDDLWVLLRP